MAKLFELSFSSARADACDDERTVYRGDDEVAATISSHAADAMDEGPRGVKNAVARDDAAFRKCKLGSGSRTMEQLTQNVEWT